MFSKIFAFTAVILAFSAQVHAHAAVAPALGVSGTPTRNDVQNPSTASPCGKIDIASALATSTPVVAAANGTFTVTAIDYNGYAFCRFFGALSLRWIFQGSRWVSQIYSTGQ